MGLTNQGPGIFRQSMPWGELYISWVPPVGIPSGTGDTRGRLRLIRGGGTVTTYFTTESWFALGSGAAAAAHGMGLRSYALASNFRYVAVKVAFDNFRLNSGELACPGTWNRTSPDWR